MPLIIVPGIPPHVRAARERREMERRARLRESIGVPCPKCGTKNLHDDGWSQSWTGGENFVATQFMCGHCNSQYAEVTRFRTEWDPETWERRRVVVLREIVLEVER